MARHLTPLMRRKAYRSISEIAEMKAKEVRIAADGSVFWTGASRSGELMARIIEGHPDDISALASALQDPHVRAALLIEIDGDPLADEYEDVLGARVVKVVSSLYAAAPTDFDGFLILTFPPLSDHVEIFRAATSAHAKMQIHQRDPDLSSILARNWKKPFHGHDHTPTFISRMLRAFRR